MTRKKYEQLKVAVQDLLEELCIGPFGLDLMAKGESPNYPGNSACIIAHPCKWQISSRVATKLLESGVLNDKV